MSSFEKSVKGATKIKAAPPKTKYIEHILVATHSGEAGIGEVFRALQNRLRDSTWTVVLKSLLTVHLMIREGSPDATLQFLAKHRNMLVISSFTDAQTQGRNVRRYAKYLDERSRSYRDTHTDWVRASASRLEKMSVEKGLLRETESVQRQLGALVKCDVLESEPPNEITTAVFRLLVQDLLSLFQVLNQGLITILGHFFEMSKPDAERAMEIYRTFTKQTDLVVQYLSVARLHEHHTRVEVPKLKHAPVHLGKQLQDYLNDTDFEIHRRQYLAEQDAKRNAGRGGSSKPFEFPKPTGSTSPAARNPFPRPRSPAVAAAAPATQPAASKGPDPDLIDFFGSIEQNQTTMQVNPQPATLQPPGFQQAQQTGAPFQNNGFVPQQTGFDPNLAFQQQQLQQQQQQQLQQQQNQSLFAIQQQPQQLQQQQQPQQLQPLQPDFTGAGFGGFTPQPSFQPSTLAPIPQNNIASFQNQQVQQPFQQPQQQQPMQTGLQPMATGQQGSNPFRQSMMPQPTGFQGNPSPFGQQNSAPPFGEQGPPALQRQSTNPFARSPPQSSSPFQPNANSPFQSAPPQPQPLQAMPTGTNPFARNPQQQDPQQQQQQQLVALAPQATGVTNPFRQGAFVNHTTGLGWQHNQQPIGGGLDQLPTQPVFPRPAQQTPWQQ